MVSPACDADTLPATNTRTNTNPSIEREDRHSCFMARTSQWGVAVPRLKVVTERNFTFCCAIIQRSSESAWCSASPAGSLTFPFAAACVPAQCRFSFRQRTSAESQPNLVERLSSWHLVKVPTNRATRGYRPRTAKDSQTIPPPL